MRRFLLTRLGLAAITLFLLSVLVFVGANLLPGNVARRKLGNLADQSAVDQLNHQLGTDKPILVQYWNWISDLLHGDLGTSLSYNLPVSELVRPRALARSSSMVSWYCGSSFRPFGRTCDSTLLCAAIPRNWLRAAISLS